MLYKVLGSLTLLLALLILGTCQLRTTVRVEHTFNAAPADVWRVWNNAGSIQKWWGPKGYTARVIRNDVRPGGSYLWAIKSAKGRLCWEHRNLQGSHPKQQNHVYDVLLRREWEGDSRLANIGSR